MTVLLTNDVCSGEIRILYLTLVLVSISPLASLARCAFEETSSWDLCKH